MSNPDIKQLTYSYSINNQIYSSSDQYIHIYTTCILKIIPLTRKIKTKDKQI